MAKIILLFLVALAAIVLLSEDEYQKNSAVLNPKIICQREKPTAIHLNFHGHADIKLITISFGRDGADIAHISIFPQKIFQENDSVGFKFFVRTKKSWKSEENLTAEERADYLKQITLSLDEIAFFQQCFNPKVAV